MKRTCLILAFASLALGQTTINGRRLIKGAVVTDSTVNYCADAGANDTYACSLSPAITAYTAGWCGSFKANTANTGAATINLNSLGAKTIKKAVGGVTSDLADNDIRAGQVVSICYDGTNMQMQSVLGNAATGGGSSTTYGTYASLPGTCTTGDQYWTSDSVYNFVCTATNTWTAFYRGQVVTIPSASGWSWSNQGSATADQTYGYLYLTVPAGSTDNVRARYRTAPSAPYYVDALVKFELPDADYSQCGIGVQASSSGARLFFGPFEDTGSNIYGLLFTNPTTFSAARGTRRKRIDRLVWLRLNDTNTNHVLSWSPDGKNWTQYLSQGRTADFTAADLIFAANSTVNVAGACMLLSWKETSGNP